LTWDALNEILECHKPSAFSMKLFREGRQVEPHLYIDGEGGKALLNAGGLIANLSQGASLVMDGIEELAPLVKDLAGAFQDMFEAVITVNLYASWGRQNAFNRHWDQQEVFVLQLAGRKEWKVYAPTRPVPLREDPEQPAEPDSPPVWEGIMEDGDMLYMPRGWWHIATPLDEPSLHLSFSLEPPNGADFLRWWLPRLLKNADVRQNLPLGLNAAVREDYFARLLKSMLADGRGRDLPGKFLREWNAYRRARPMVRLPAMPQVQKMPLELATPVRLAQRDGLLIEWEPGERSAKVQAGGRQYDIWAPILPALEKLSSRKSLTVRELCAGISDPQKIVEVVKVLELLAGDGVILKEAPPT
jgi:ribosomal protein L16 Arg81 hydroxylase